MAKRETKSLTDNAFVKTATKAAEKGLTPEQALDAAAEAVGISPDRNLPAVVRRDLGLDDEETRVAFGRAIAQQSLNANAGQFPAFIEDPELTPAERVKARLDYLKHVNNVAASALITTKSKAIFEADETEGRSDAEIEFRLAMRRWPTDEEVEYRRLHKCWPHDRTIDGDSAAAAIN